MIFFDSHCHLYDESFIKDFNDVLNRAKNAGVMKMVTVGIDEPTSNSAANLAHKFEGIYASVGVHPHNADQFDGETIDHLVKLSQQPKVVAWGEIGLDFNRMYSGRKQQESCFVRQIEVAGNLHMPIILHERDTEGALLEILNTHRNSFGAAVVHCFSGNEHELGKYLEMGLYIGITGIISILKRGKQLRGLVKNIPSDRILVETDAPYLVPVPQKNKTRRNEPAFVKDILLKLGEVRQEDAKMLSKQLWDNTCTFFKIPVFP